MFARLKFGLVGFVMGVGVGTFGVARAETSCTQGWDGGSQCTSGVRSDKLDQTVGQVGGQRASQWCWAASIAMVFRHYGFEVAQQRIVAETFGQVIDAGASSDDIVKALSRTWTDDHGRRFQVQADAYSASNETAIADLDQDHPLIVGTFGHAMVLTALSYTSGARGPEVIGAMVRDPWPGRGRRPLSGQEWFGADLLVRVRVTAATRQASAEGVDDLVGFDLLRLLDRLEGAEQGHDDEDADEDRERLHAPARGEQRHRQHQPVDYLDDDGDDDGDL